MAWRERIIGRLVKDVRKDEAFTFSAQVVKVTTLVDGGIRITFDLPETAIETATKMMQVKQSGCLLEVAAVPIKVKSAGKSRKIQTPDDTNPTY